MTAFVYFARGGQATVRTDDPLLHKSDTAWRDVT